MSAKTARIGVAGVLINTSGEVLLGRRAHMPGKNLWAFPGGHLEFGETLSDALTREFVEETGLMVRVGKLLYVGEIIESEFHFVLLDYAVEVLSGELHPGSDLNAVKWVNPVALGDYALAEGMQAGLSSGSMRRHIDETIP